jgi:hypothetical protein
MSVSMFVDMSLAISDLTPLDFILGESTAHISYRLIIVMTSLCKK